MEAIRFKSLFLAMINLSTYGASIYQSTLKQMTPLPFCFSFFTKELSFTSQNIHQCARNCTQIQTQLQKPTPRTVSPLCALNFLPFEVELLVQVAAKLCQLHSHNLASETVPWIKGKKKDGDWKNKDKGVETRIYWKDSLGKAVRGRGTSVSRISIQLTHNKLIFSKKMKSNRRTDISAFCQSKACVSLRWEEVLKDRWSSRTILPHISGRVPSSLAYQLHEWKMHWCCPPCPVFTVCI